MAPALSPFFQDHSFDPFLFSVVGEERNGMLLSMLSALARLDLDPWFEAKTLSRLPAPAATERLTSLLSSLPIAQLKAPASATVMRWVGLLPQPEREAPWSPRAAGAKESKLNWPAIGLILAAFVVMFSAQFAERRGPIQPTGGALSPATNRLDPSATKARGDSQSHAQRRAG